VRPEGRELSRRRTMLFAGVVVPLGLACVWLGGASFVWWSDTRDLDARAATQCAQRFEDAPGPRLLFLGDSFTAGDGSESETGFWAYLPAALERRGVVGAQTRSLAISGSTTGYQLDQLRCWVETSGQRLDTVVVTAGVNDWGSLRFQRQFLEEGAPGSHPAALSGLYRLPRPVLFAVHYPLRLADRMRSPAHAWAQEGQNDGGWVPGWGYFSDHPEYGDWVADRQRRNLEEMAELAGAAGGELVVAAYVVNDARNPAGHAEGDWTSFLEPAEASGSAAAGGLLSDDAWHLSDAGARDLAERWAGWLAGGGGR